MLITLIDSQLLLKESIKGTESLIDGAKHAAQQLGTKLNGASNLIGCGTEIGRNLLKRLVGRRLQKDIRGFEVEESGGIGIVAIWLEISIGSDEIVFDDMVWDPEGFEQQRCANAGPITTSGTVEEKLGGGTKCE